MKNILIVSTNYYPTSNAVNMRMKSLIQELDNKQYTIDIMTHKDAQPMLDEKIITTNCPLPKNTYKLLKRLILEILFGIETFFKILFLTKKYNIAIVTSPPYIPSLFAMYACYFKKIQFIADTRDFYPDGYFNAGVVSKNNIFVKILHKLNKFIYSKAKHVTFVMGDIHNQFTKYNIVPTVIKNGFDEKTILQKKSYFHEKEHDNSTFNILFHGSLSIAYDIQKFNQIAKKLHEKSPVKINFTLISRGQMIEKVDTKYINICEPVKYEHIPKKLIEADLGFIYGINRPEIHGFPVKIFEYIGANIPIFIGGPIPAGELFKNENMAITANNVDEAVDEILNIIDNSDKYLNLVHNLKNNSHKFSRKHQSKILIELIKN